MDGVRIRAAGPDDFAAVRECMSAVFRETAPERAAQFNEAMWTWQYLANPQGSLVVMAEDEAGPCGYYHAMFCAMRHRGSPCTAAMVQDVGTLASHRGRGIFRQVGAFALKSLGARGTDFIYTFPNARSLPSFIRDHSYRIAGRAPAYLLPLRLGPLLAERLRLGPIGRGLGALLGPGHRVLCTRSPRLRTDEHAVAMAGFDERVTPLVDAFAPPDGVCLERTPAYLNWRFMEKPSREYTAWGLWRGDTLAAYTVTRPAAIMDTSCVLFMDFGCRAGEETALVRLIATRLSAERAAGTVLAVTMGLHPVCARLRGLGFLRVPERLNPRPFNLVIKDLAGSERPDLVEPLNWLISLADWDVF
jgi:GNAT superfamily N-acetyltransferase